MTEAIPEAELQAATLKMCRRIAAVMITAMAESGVSYELIEKRLRKRKNWARKLVDSLITGAGADKDASLRDLAGFMFACDGSILEFRMEPKAPEVQTPMQPE